MGRVPAEWTALNDMTVYPSERSALRCASVKLWYDLSYVGGDRVSGTQVFPVNPMILALFRFAFVMR